MGGFVWDFDVLVVCLIRFVSGWGCLRVGLVGLGGIAV